MNPSAPETNGDRRAGCRTAPPQSQPQPRLLRAVWCLVVVAGLSLAVRSLPYQVDDAYINYRYAINIVAGHGFTYNPGQPPVEGFTSPVWLAGVTLAARWVALDRLPWCATVAGLVAFVALLAIMGWGLWKRDGPDIRLEARVALTAAALFALLPTAVSYAATGLESCLFAAVVGAFAAAAAGALPPVAGLMAAFLAIWVRPEGAWLLVALAAQRLAMDGLYGLRDRRAWLLVLAVIAGGSLLVAVRWTIFGELLPNTFHAKDPSWREGWCYLAGMLASPPVLGLIACALVGAWYGGRTCRGYLAAALAWAVAAVLEGGDWMPGGRLLLPAFTLLCLAGGGVAAVLAHPRRTWRVAAAGLVLATLGGEARLTWEFTGSAGQASASYRREARVIADWVKTSGARSLALIDIGETGFRTGVEIVDLAGLTDRVIARSPGGLLAKTFDLAYLFEERAPDLILVRLARSPAVARDGRFDLPERVAPADAMSPVEARVLADPRLARDYEPLLLQMPAAPRRPLHARMVYGRKGRSLDPRAAAIRGVVEVGP